MQAAHHFRFYNRAIRTKIGEGLRTLFVPTEPPPKRLLELLHVLDQPNRATSGTEENLDEVRKKLPRARRTRKRFAGQKRGKERAVPFYNRQRKTHLPSELWSQARSAAHMRSI
jgi:hypothetical protein